MKKILMRSAIVAVLSIGFSIASVAAEKPIKIGFITDMSGVYADLDGPGGAEAIKMAIEDFGGAVNGREVQLLVADHQNKADIAASKARQWYDDGVDAIIGGTNSSANLAILHIATEKKKPFLSASSSSTRLTNEDCNPYTIQYVTDTVATARVAGSAIVKEGGKSWFFITADVAFGHSLEKDVAETVKSEGGTVVGAVRHPLGNSDFSSMLLQAQASGAQVLGLATGGSDLINVIKGANEFNLGRTMKIAAPLMFLTDIHALGLEMAQGLYYTDGWYWDYDDDSRAWAKRYFERRNSMPTMYQAGDASVTAHYLNAVKVVGTDSDKVMEQMKKSPINDFFAKNGKIRPDGRMVHDMFLMQIKSPSESKYPWDYVRVVKVVPGDSVFLSQEESRCAGWGKSAS